MSKGGLIGFELRLDQLLELTKPRVKRVRRAKRVRISPFDVSLPTSMSRVVPRTYFERTGVPAHMVPPADDETLEVLEARRARKLRGGKRRGGMPTGAGYFVQILIRGLRRATWVSVAKARDTLAEALVVAERQTDVGHMVRVVHNGQVVWPSGGKARR